MSSDTDTQNPWTAISDQLVAQLRARGAGATAPGAGDAFPDFVLPDSLGHPFTLSRALQRGPIVLSFLRGRWCPYCEMEMRAWQNALPALEALHGQFFAITAEVGGRAEEFRCDIAPGAGMLCDVDNGLALTLGLAFPVPEALHERYVAAGIDLAAYFGNSGRILPLPATYIIDQSARVRYAFVDADFRRRADPQDVLAVLTAIG